LLKHQQSVQVKLLRRDLAKGTLIIIAKILVDEIYEGPGEQG